MGLVATSLSKTYQTRRQGETVALGSVDFQASTGELLVLLGPSGSGKTTALRCIAGLVDPDVGKIECGGRTFFDGKRGINIPVESRRLSMVFQNYALWPHMMVVDNVGFGLKMQGAKQQARQDRAESMLSLVGLNGYGGRRVNELSGGQMQRVALARALAVDPDVILMDEPLSNLDPAIRIELRDEIKRIQQGSGRTTIYVTHDQEEALTLADRIAVFKEGAIVQIGKSEDVRLRPNHPFVAKFMGWKNLLSYSFDASSVVISSDERIPNRASGPYVLLSRDVLAQESVVDSHGQVALHPQAIRVLPLTEAEQSSGIQGASAHTALLKGKVESLEQVGLNSRSGTVALDGGVTLQFQDAGGLRSTVRDGDEVLASLDFSDAVWYPGDLRD